ncbi:MAG: peptide chain release factor N(5)-glutamine methyltransferase [Sphingobacteriia bacterium]|nr:peptide chain release factor N(5)-glutamine methyltransferase [Sphingobacteriia bacterium]
MKPAIVAKLKTELTPLFSDNEIQNFTCLILERVAGLSYTEIFTHDDFKFSNEQLLIIDQIIERLKNKEPIQYILGETDFLKSRFWVDGRALIPRPETEELITWVIESNIKEQPKILDIGTGCGCIAISLGQKIKNSNISAFDISLDALHLAHENAEINNVFVRFYHVNILKQPIWDETFDIIVSNPPYVLQSEKADMDENVLNFEPSIALFVSDDDPLLFYRHIGQFALNQLNPEGQLFFEINQAFGKEIIKLLKKIGFKDVELRQDLSGHDRFVKATK